MVIRNTRPVTVVTQPTHAWLAGRLGRAWGNTRFPRPPLMEDLVFAAIQHDIGYLDWELMPTVDPDTGQPHTYRTLPCDTHLALWRRGISRMEPVSRFAALMISLHSSGLYDCHFDWETAPEPDKELVRAFIAEQRAYQDRTIASLSRSPRYRVLNDGETVRRLSFLLGTWDLMSLQLCEREPGPLVLDKVPDLRDTSTVQLQRLRSVPELWRVDPWPFSEPELDLCFDVRVIRPPYPGDDPLRAELQEGSTQTVQLRLIPVEPADT